MTYLHRFFIGFAVLICSQQSMAAVTTYSFELDYLNALGSATTITENFDALTAESVINNGETINGITYDYSPLEAGPILMIDSFFDTTSGLNYLSTDDGFGFLGGDSLTITFDQTLFAIGLYIITDSFLEDGDITLTTNNGQQASNSEFPDTDVFLFDADAFFIGLIEDDLGQGFNSITLSSLDEGFFFTIDDITAATVAAPVPLPAAFGLFSFGLFSLGFLRRRTIH